MGLMNKQTDLIGESYKNYLTMTEPTFIGKNISLHEYIHWIKTDEKYSEKWGLKIEERELGLEERHQISLNRIGHDGVADRVNMTWHETYNKTGIPTKLITVTYNDKTIESYE